MRKALCILILFLQVVFILNGKFSFRKFEENLMNFENNENYNNDDNDNKDKEDLLTQLIKRKEIKAKKKNIKSKKNKENENENDKNCIEFKKEDKIQKNKFLKSTIKLKNWLKISSENFLDKDLYPPLILPNSQKISLNINTDLFRINAFYDKEDPQNSPPDQLSFWFRLNGNQIYYSNNKDDLNVLGAFIVKDIINSDFLNGTDNVNFCFEIKDLHNLFWKICAKNLKEQITWVCAVHKNIKKVNKLCNKETLTKIMQQIKSKKYQEEEKKCNKKKTKEIIKPIILLPIPRNECNENWNYDEQGKDWNCQCKEGKLQSPIDLPLNKKIKKTDKKPLFQYDEIFPGFSAHSPDGEILLDQKVKISLERNLLRIKHRSFGKIIYLNGSVFNAKEIIFHTPSEHKINGKVFDMEMQVIHIGEKSADLSKKVILSFLFERKSGAYNQFIEDLDFFNLPDYRQSSINIEKKIYIPKIFYSLGDENLTIMKPFSFYKYDGSLTFPPCEESVTFYVSDKPVEISSTALEMFKEAIKTYKDFNHENNNLKKDKKNNRGIQDLNNREIVYYNHEENVGPDPTIKKNSNVEQRHYEKIMKESYDYVYIDSDSPTGLPGSLIVNKREFKENEEIKKLKKIEEEKKCIF